MGAIRSVLVLGGTRSGKSALAEEMFVGDDDVIYVATAEVASSDVEFRSRIHNHQIRRPSTWGTWEGRSFSELIDTLGALPHSILVDSLGSLTTSALIAEVSLGEFGSLVGEFCEMISQRPYRSVLVSEEVGLSVHPRSDLGRRFVEFQGLFNQHISRVVDACYLVVAHRVVPLKALEPTKLWESSDVE